MLKTQEIKNTKKKRYPFQLKNCLLIPIKYFKDLNN